MSQGSGFESLRAEVLALLHKPMFREGAREAVPMAIGIGAWGLVAGVAMSKSGMGIPLAIFMSVIVCRLPVGRCSRPDFVRQRICLRRS